MEASAAVAVEQLADAPVGEPPAVAVDEQCTAVMSGGEDEGGTGFPEITLQ